MLQTLVARTTTDKLQETIEGFERDGWQLCDPIHTGGRDWVIFFTVPPKVITTSTVGTDAAVTLIEQARVRETDLAMLARLGVDAGKWAREFMQRRVSSGTLRNNSEDEGTILVWFANAIEAGITEGMKRAAAIEEEDR